MIDTISIEIDAGRQLDENDFASPAKITKSKTNDKKRGAINSVTIVLDWPLDEVLECDYLPEVAYMSYPNPLGGGKYGFCYVYRITMSVPKFLYGNNILEVGEDQFEEIVELLHSKLSALGLPTEVTKDDIRNAIVRRVDYGKNIILPGDASISTLTNILERAEHRLGSRYAQVQYRDGDLYREGIKERQFIVYDKIAEFRNTSSPYDIIEKLFVSLSNSNQLQIARVELQIQSTKQLKQQLKSLKLPENKTTFVDVFSIDLARQILLKHWGNLVKTIGTEAEPLGPDHLMETLNGLMMTNPPQKAFAKLGFAVVAGECGLNKIKKTFCSYNDKKLWSRTKNDLHMLLDRRVEYPYIKMIAKTIEGMPLIRIEEVKNDEE